MVDIEARKLAGQFHDSEKIVEQYQILDAARLSIPNPSLSMPARSHYQDTPMVVPETEGDEQRVGLFKDPYIRPIKKVKKASARKAALVQKVHSQIPEDLQWIFIMDQDRWHEHLPSDWTTSAQ